MSETLSILVVDDNPPMVKTLADVLEAKGFEAYPAGSGAEALEILRDHPVDILLTDVIMSGMNGVALYREARKICPQIVPFLMTAYAADDLIQAGLKEGIKTILNKPVDIDFLLILLSATRRISN